MQQFVEMVGGFVGGVQRMFGMVLLAGLALSVIIAVTIYATAPVIAEEAGERIEGFAERELAQAMDEQRAARCDRLRAKAAAAWDRAIADNAGDRAYQQIDELDRQAERYCNP